LTGGSPGYELPKAKKILGHGDRNIDIEKVVFSVHNREGANGLKVSSFFISHSLTVVSELLCHQAKAKSSQKWGNKKCK
jgi:hypothetical protein